MVVVLYETCKSQLGKIYVKNFEGVSSLGTKITFNRSIKKTLQQQRLQVNYR